MSQKMKVTADWIMGEDSGISALRLPIKFPHEEMYKEAANIHDSFVDYSGLLGPGVVAASGKKISEEEDTPDDGGGYMGWKGVCLHGLGPNILGSARSNGYSEEETAPYKWTEAADRCPIMTNFLKGLDIFDRFFRVRIWLLEPGGYIRWHNDYIKRSVLPINFQLNHPLGCKFIMKGRGPLLFKAGRAFLLDLSNMHWVENTSSINRYHLTVHGQFSSKFDDMLLEAFDNQYPFD